MNSLIETFVMLLNEPIVKYPMIAIMSILGILCIAAILYDIYQMGCK